MKADNASTDIQAPLLNNIPSLKTFFDRFAMIIAIVAAMVIGALLGNIFGPKVASLSGLTDIFMWLIKGLTPYLIFLSITTGILSVGSLDRLKTLGAKAGAIGGA